MLKNKDNVKIQPSHFSVPIKRCSKQKKETDDKKKTWSYTHRVFNFALVHRQIFIHNIY